MNLLPFSHEQMQAFAALERQAAGRFEENFATVCQEGAAEAYERLCAICLSRFASLRDKKESDLLAATPCHHMFCRPCFDSSERRQARCPLCREDLRNRYATRSLPVSLYRDQFFSCHSGFMIYQAYRQHLNLPSSLSPQEVRKSLRPLRNFRASPNYASALLLKEQASLYMLISLRQSSRIWRQFVDRMAQRQTAQDDQHRAYTAALFLKYLFDGRAVELATQIRSASQESRQEAAPQDQALQGSLADQSDLAIMPIIILKQHSYELVSHYDYDHNFAHHLLAISLPSVVAQASAELMAKLRGAPATGQGNKDKGQRLGLLSEALILAGLAEGLNKETLLEHFDRIHRSLGANPSDQSAEDLHSSLLAALQALTNDDELKNPFALVLQEDLTYLYQKLAEEKVQTSACAIQ